MADTTFNEQSPFEAWSKLIGNTMGTGGNAAQQKTSGQPEEGKEDPWITLIDRLWQANPYSKLLPIDPAEIMRAFQQVWIDAINNPGRAWANYSDFVQRYTQL